MHKIRSRHSQSNSICLLPKRTTERRPSFRLVAEFATQPNRQLRKLLVVGAHAALGSMKSGKTRTALADWARALLASKPFRLVAVALANKIARIAWAVMARGTVYELKTPTVTVSA